MAHAESVPQILAKRHTDPSQSILAFTLQLILNFINRSIKGLQGYDFVLFMNNNNF